MGSSFNESKIDFNIIFKCGFKPNLTPKLTQGEGCLPLS